MPSRLSGSGSDMTSEFDMDREERRLERLARDWVAVRSDEAARAADIDRWTRVIADLLAEQRRMEAEGLWTVGPSDLLSVIGHERREVTHCRVLAWLCDPRAPHGLGVSFLQAIMRALGRDVPAHQLAGASSEVEVSRSRSRADIVITTSRITLVIEAKIDALERSEQCDDLYRDWREEGDVVFVFLTPRGRPPLTATGEACDAFSVLSFRRVRELLSHTTAASVRSRGEAVVRSYLATLEKEFP